MEHQGSEHSAATGADGAYGSRDKDGTGGISAQARAQAYEAADQAKQAAQQARDAAQSIMQRQKDYGADQMDGIARAAHGAAHELEGQLPMAADYVRDAANRIERASASLRERGVEDILGSIAQFARSQPAALFGGAIVAGFAISRFLKSSGHRPHEPRHDSRAHDGAYGNVSDRRTY